MMEGACQLCIKQLIDLKTLADKAKLLVIQLKHKILNPKSLVNVPLPSFKKHQTASKTRELSNQISVKADPWGVNVLSDKPLNLLTKVPQQKTTSSRFE